VEVLPVQERIVADLVDACVLGDALVVPVKRRVEVAEHVRLLAAIVHEPWPPIVAHAVPVFGEERRREEKPH
jgi:hypothetical protein